MSRLTDLRSIGRRTVCFVRITGLVGLRPKLLQQLLEVCSSIKAKRLLFYLADLAESPWRQFIDRSQIDLGRGHRRLVEEGVYVAEYKITVPRELARP